MASNLVKKAADDYERLIQEKGMNKEQAMEGCSQGRFVAAKVCGLLV